MKQGRVMGMVMRCCAYWSRLCEQRLATVTGPPQHKLTRVMRTPQAL